MTERVQNQQSKTSKHALALILAVGAAVALAYGAGEFSHLVSFSLSEAGAPDFFREPINLAIAFVGLLIWQRLGQTPASTPPLWGSPVIGLGWGWIVGCALPGLALLGLELLQVGRFEARDFPMAALIIPVPFILIHATSEEIIIRGISQRAGHAAFGPWAGIGVAALTFCILQTLQGYQSIWHIANSALFGAVLGVLALGRGGIWAAVAGHAGWTWLETSWIGDAVMLYKDGSFLAGAGPDSYASPIFTLVLILTLTAFGLNKALQASKEKQ